VTAGCELCALVASPDTTVVWRNEQLSVLLVADAAYPGFCRVVWNGHVKEMTDLTPTERTVMMDAVWQVEFAVREVMRPEKVNLASLGNMTPHLHWHVIPRYADDAHFPSPVWAEVQRSTPAEAMNGRLDAMQRLRAAIVQRLSA
jgi:diadenosine tetraphosphate (Ap4A) HIT family hydrolase